MMASSPLRSPTSSRIRRSNRSTAARAASIRGGLIGDDVRHALILRGDTGIPGLEHSPFDLFVFATGEREYWEQMLDAGIYPWWASPDVRLAFLRPVSSFFHWVDFQLWPDSGVMMHLHSIAWFAVVLVLAAAVYRRLCPTPLLAGLAFLLFALDDAHSTPAAWLANRYGLVALSLALGTFLAYERWRTDGWRPGAWLGPLIFSVAILAGESALAIGAYLFAHAVFLDRAPWRARIAALAPYAVLVVAWRVAYQALGYGATGSAAYYDPGRDGLAFVVPLLQRLQRCCSHFTLHTVHCLQFTA